MQTKNQLKYYTQLNQKKHREQEQKFIVEGSKLILEALNAGYKCEIIFATHLFEESNRDFFEHRLIKTQDIQLIKKNDLEKIAATKTPQEVIGIFCFPENDRLEYSNQKLIAALENISDPGNLGTILRNCDWFGIKTVFLSSDCVDIYNPKVIRASAGAVFHLHNVEAVDLFDQLKKLKREGYKILCSDLSGKNIYEFIVPSKSVLILSNEAHGPSKEVLSAADYSVTIPRKGKAESLNVASASAVLLSHLTK